MLAGFIALLIKSFCFNYLLRINIVFSVSNPGILTSLTLVLSLTYKLIFLEQ